VSQENVEIVRQFVALVNAQDLDNAMLRVAPDAELDWSRSEAPDGGVHAGRESWLKWIAGRSEALSGARFEPSDVIDVPPDRVVLVAELRGTGRMSGLEAVALAAAVITLRDGLLTRLTLYQTPGEALEAARVGK
jgi:ketosteroid isomerase-like protein